MTELGNIRAQDVGILTGLNGLREAILQPEQWQARSPWCEWRNYSGKWGWVNWRIVDIMAEENQWRRRPEKRAVMRFAVDAEIQCSLTTHDNSDGLTISSSCRIGSLWIGKRARITVEELVDASAADTPSVWSPCSREFAESHPGESEYRCRYIAVLDWGRWVGMGSYRDDIGMVFEFRTSATQSDTPSVPQYGPGETIPWQVAQSRIDAGLPVELEGGTSDTWTLVNPEHHVCGNRRRYRIPPEPNAVGMTPLAAVTLERDEARCQLRAMTAERDKLTRLLSVERALNASIKTAIRNMGGKD